MCTRSSASLKTTGECTDFHLDAPGGTPPGQICALPPPYASRTSYMASAPDEGGIRVRHAIKCRRLQLRGNEEMANYFFSSIVRTALVRGRAQGNSSTATRTLQSSTVLGSIPRPPSTSPRLPRILLLFSARRTGLGSWVGPLWKVDSAAPSEQETS